MSNDSDRSPRRGMGPSKAIEKQDGSASKTEISAVYRLESSDGPGNILIACNLNGDNYLTWSRAMLIALRAKGKLPFIDGTLQKPEEGDPMRERWEMCNSTLIAWIFNTMEKDLQSTVACAVDAMELWEDLKERYSEGNLARIYQIKSDICLLKQEGKSVREYYGKLKQLWDELEFYVDKPGCSCGANNRFMAQREIEKIFQFLMGLTSEFNMVRSNILSIEPMPSLNKVYQMVVHEERQKIVVRSQESEQEAMAFLVKGGAPISTGSATKQQKSDAKPQLMSDTKPVCDHCGKIGHLRSNCWALNGYPAWFGGDRGGQGSWGRSRKLAGQIRDRTTPGQWKQGALQRDRGQPGQWKQDALQREEGQRGKGLPFHKIPERVHAVQAGQSS
ncbi:NmrA domain-containing protein [Psidium guajava]|nr:NmrA domain-containing protein [Psidium guajava]